MPLTSHFHGIAYSLSLRSRRVLLAMVTAAALTGALAHFFSPAAWMPWVQATVIGLYGLGMAFLTSVFTYSSNDLGATESGFPRYMLTLPVRSAALVGLPMLIGTAVMAMLWACLDGLVLNPLLHTAGPGHVSLLWSSLMVAAIIAWLQAISWSPFWIPYFRAMLATAVLLGQLALGIFGSRGGLSSNLLASIYFAATLAAYPLAVAGLSRAQRGAGSTTPWAARSTVNGSQTMVVRRPFASPLAAQTWFEFRRNTVMIPCIAVAIALFMTILTAKTGGKATPIPYGPFTFHPIYFAVGVALASPLLAVMMHGAMLGKSDAWSKSITVSPFISARPLSSAGIIRAKLNAAALATIISWGAVVVIVAIWSLCKGVMGPQRTISYLVPHVTPRGTLMAAYVLVMLVILTWKVIAQSLFMYLYGRTWIATTIPIAGMLLFMGLAALGTYVVRTSAALHAAGIALPWIVGGILTIRLIAAGLLFAFTPRLGVITQRQATGLATAWLLLAIAFFAFLLWVIPGGARPSLLMLVATAALFPPGVRTFVALPALHANRHR